jgi:hypothetical protein
MKPLLLKETYENDKLVLRSTLFDLYGTADGDA